MSEYDDYLSFQAQGYSQNLPFDESQPQIQFLQNRENSKENTQLLKVLKFQPKYQPQTYGSTQESKKNFKKASPARLRKFKNRINCQQETMLKCQQTFQGTKDDTVELNTNFKTIIYKFLREFRALKEFDDAEEEQIISYGHRIPSFKSFLTLCQRSNGEARSQKVRNICLEFITSSAIINRVLTGRGKMRTKLQMLKYIQALGINIRGDGKVTKWKDIKQDTDFSQGIN